MSAFTLPSQAMDKRKNMPVRISDEAMKWARVAASYREMSVAEYVSEALLEIAKRDAEAGHAALMGPGPEPATPKRKAKGDPK